MNIKNHSSVFKWAAVGAIAAAALLTMGSASARTSWSVQIGTPGYVETYPAAPAYYPPAPSTTPLRRRSITGRRRPCTTVRHRSMCRRRAASTTAPAIRTVRRTATTTKTATEAFLNPWHAFWHAIFVSGSDEKVTISHTY